MRHLRKHISLSTECAEDQSTENKDGYKDHDCK